jgi:hypothetical protein
MPIRKRGHTAPSVTTSILYHYCRKISFIVMTFPARWLANLVRSFPPGWDLLISGCPSLFTFFPEPIRRSMPRRFAA